MPHATMERRHQPGVGSGGQNRPMYYTLQPSNRNHHGQVSIDNYGSLPSQGTMSTQNYAGNNYNTLPTQTSGVNQSGSIHGTLPRNASPLPSYNNNNFNSLPRQSGGYNSLPPQQGNYGTLPTHHEYKSQTLPHPPRDMGQRQLPAPSLSRHTVKVLQVPILVVGEGGNNVVAMANPVIPSPSHSPSSSSTVSDPPAAPSPTLSARGGIQGVSAQRPVHHRPGYVHPNSQPPQPQPTAQYIIEPSQSHGYSSGSSTLGPQNNKSYPQATSTHDYSNVGTWPPHPNAIPNHIQHPSPSPSPTSSTTSATLPHPHHSAMPPPRPPPVPTPGPQPSRINTNATVHVHAPSPHPSPSPVPHHHNSELSVQQHQARAPSPRISTPNGQMSTPSPKGFNHDNTVVAQPHGNVDDFSVKIREMQSEMDRMQKQMEHQFRNMHMGGPPPPMAKSGFPDFPPMITPPFGSLPGSMDNMHSQSSLNTIGTPAIMEPNFGTMRSSNDIGGGPLIEDSSELKGGKKQLKLNLDMHDFMPEEVKVKSDKNKLEVTAHHEEKDPNRVTCRVFHQQYHLPPNVRMAKMKYDMTPTGELKVEGTVKPRHRVKWAEDTLTK